MIIKKFTPLEVDCSHRVLESRLASKQTQALLSKKKLPV